MKLFRIKAFTCLVTSLLAGLADVHAQNKNEPLSSELKESIEVRLVLIDTMVADVQGRTVPNLTKKDFELLVEGNPTEIKTFDVDCPAGSVSDVKGTRDRTPPSAPEVPRNIVLVFDYMHLGQVDQAIMLEHAQEMIRKAKPAGEKVMLVALTGGIRFELPFTQDQQRILDALYRMEHDITLWQGNYFHQRDNRFFEGLFTILNVLETLPGRKAMILYSNVNAPLDGEYDQQFAELAAEAAVARTSIYPVYAAGVDGRPAVPT